MKPEERSLRCHVMLLLWKRLRWIAVTVARMGWHKEITLFYLTICSLKSGILKPLSLKETLDALLYVRLSLGSPSCRKELWR